MLVVGENAGGVVVSLPPGKPYGWLRVYDVHGNRAHVYLPLPDGSHAYKIGETLSFKVGSNDKGAIATDVSMEVDEAA